MMIRRQHGPIMMALRYCLPFLFLQLAWLCTTSWALLALPCIIVAFLIGEAIFGSDRDAARAPPAAQLYRWLPRLFVPLQLAAVVLALHLISEPAMTSTGFVALTLAIGATAGIFGMLSAHELIHCRSALDRSLGLAMLASTSYMHFRLSHLHGHHRFAATPNDPATARRGESLYYFVLRSVIGQYHQCWHFESRRTRNGGLSWRANRMMLYLVLTLLVYMGAGLIAGLRGMAFMALQSLLALFILEAFNYVAHYGLERQRQSDGRYERLADRHSWNTARCFSNSALFNAGGHSHHHAEPARPFDQLRPRAGAPELPFGYAGSILLALLPPLWRRVMDRRIPRIDRALAVAGSRASATKETWPWPHRPARSA
jgi:alkane 1-monooxygenase